MIRKPLLTSSLLTFALATCFSAAAQVVATPSAMATAAADSTLTVWDLTRLFATDVAWDAERLGLIAALPALRELRGTLGRDAASLRNALDQVSALRQRLQCVAVYASTQLSTDSRVPRNQERSSLLRSAFGQFSASLAWMNPEIQALGSDKVEAFIAAEPGLARHAFALRDTLRQARHTLRADAEAAMAALSPVVNAPTNLRTMLINADTQWPTLQVDGKAVRLNDNGYQQLRAHPDALKGDREYSVAQSSMLTLAAVEPLGAEYRELLRQALSAPTMHAHLAEGKQSGAYQSGVYGHLPFVFLNHRNTWDSLTTFAHEWGHGVHSMLAQRAQPFETAAYSLFVAETASIGNEVLLSDHMLKQAATPRERLYVLTQVLERARASFFRQAMFAEFELQTHDALERGEALSGQRFTRMYCELLRKYHGADQV